MLNLTRPDFKKFRSLLLKQQKKIEKDLKVLKTDDPVMATDQVAESGELGTDSWMAEVHGRAVSVGHTLQDMLNGIKKSLKNLKKGKYGKCESCGKMIESERLEAMPTATLCISCSKKTVKK